MNIPNTLKYTETHEWIRQEGDVWVIGITDPAQDMLGDLVYAGNVEEGAHLEQGETAGVVESVKAASDIYAPANGTVVAFNADLDADVAAINTDPYGVWIFKFKPDNPADLQKLLDAAAYQAVVDAS